MIKEKISTFFRFIVNSILLDFSFLLPLLFINCSIWEKVVFFVIQLIASRTNIVFLVWGLVDAIRGPQNFMTIIYYIYLLIFIVIPYLSSLRKKTTY